MREAISRAGSSIHKWMPRSSMDSQT